MSYENLLEKEEEIKQIDEFQMVDPNFYFKLKTAEKDKKFLFKKFNIKEFSS